MKFEDLVVLDYGDMGAPMHRGSEEYLTHFVQNLEGSIDGISVLLVKESMTNSWWITPNCTADEELMEDLGPYETLEEAVLHFKLIADLDD